MSAGLQELVESIVSMELTAADLQANASSYFNVDSGGVTYTIDGTSLTLDGIVDCPSGSVSDDGLCGKLSGSNDVVFTETVHNQVPLLDRSDPFMDEIVVTKEGETKLLKGLNPSKAYGPDGLHPRVLKDLAKELGPVFEHLYQQSIKAGEILKKSSLSNICPLFKKGDRSLACNYRPVSLAYIPCKLQEHIVYSYILGHCLFVLFHLDQHNFYQTNIMHSGNGTVVKHS